MPLYFNSEFLKLAGGSSCEKMTDPLAKQLLYGVSSVLFPNVLSIGNNTCYKAERGCANILC